MKRDNKGLSLVELIVAFAILAIVGIAITGFMAYSSRGYANSNKNTKLQYEQQIVENHIRDNVMETTKGISFDAATSTLTLLGGKLGPSSNIEVSQYRYVAPVLDGDGNVTTSGKLYYLHQDSGITATKFSEIAGQLDRDANEIELTDTMAGFDFDLTKVEADQKVLATLTFKVGDSSPITVYPEILLRNKIKVVGPYISGDDTTDTDLDEIYDPDEFEVTDKVASVVIKRDDHTFAQGETDTVNMAGTSTTVHYDAIVTKKSTYMGELTGDIVWSIVNKDNFKSDWANYISLSDGTLTFRIIDGKGPQSYAMNGQSYIILRASYKDGDELTKYGQIRVVVNESGGVYPETLATTVTSTQNVNVGTLDYQLTHTIRYTDGSFVNGDAAYTKLTYAVREADGTPSDKTITSTGKFVATKSMEDTTYLIDVTVTQKKKDGTTLKETVTINVGKVPDKKGDVTVPILAVDNEILRNDNNAVSAFWSDGVPTYDNGENYYYWYELEIEPVKLEKTDSWYDIADASDRAHMSRELTTFNSGNYKNVSLSSTTVGDKGYWDSETLWRNGLGGTTLTMDRTKRVGYLYVVPYIDWNKTFAVKVSLRVRLNKNNNYSNSQYYVMNSESDNDNAILSSNKSDAYVATKTVKISPVKMTLTPVSGARFYNGQVILNAYYYNDDYIKWGYNSRWDNDYNGNTHQWIGGKEYSNYYGTYYKVFEPSFTGLYINTNKFPYTLANIYYGQRDYGFQYNALDAQGTATTQSSLRRFKKNDASGNYEAANVSSSYYECDFYRNNQAILLAYLKINARDMKNRYTDYPDYVEWKPIVKDSKGNVAEAPILRYYTKSEYESKTPDKMN